MNIYTFYVNDSSNYETKDHVKYKCIWSKSCVCAYKYILNIFRIINIEDKYV